MDTCKHGLKVCSKCIIVSDAARRMSDIINVKLVSHPHWELQNCWMAFNLGSGETDGVLYDSRVDAVNHQLDERYCAFFCFRNAMNGTNPRDCQLFLSVNRSAVGMKLYEPNAPQLIIPTAYADRYFGHKRPGSG